jgi:hypothetical protein
MKNLVTLACALLATGAAFAGSSSADDNLANRTPFVGTATRADVEAELARATQSGDLYGAHGTQMINLARYAYPPRTAPEGKSAEQAQRELATAMRDGDMLAHDESGLTYAQQNPARFARSQADDDARQLAGATPLAVD